MPFRGKDPIRTKICLNNKLAEKISHFNYLRFDISYNYDRDLPEKSINLDGYAAHYKEP